MYIGGDGVRKKLDEYAKKLKISDIGVCEARIYDELCDVLDKYDTPFTAPTQRRISPFEFVKNARSVIMCVFNYYTEGDDDCNLSRYVWGCDYHEVVKDKLEKLCTLLKDDFGDFEHYIFCDDSPLCDKHLAYLAGLGFVGKNHLLIHPKYGSYVFIGGIVSELELPFDKPLQNLCMDCGLCQQKCPAHAFDNGFDAHLCASYIMQKKGELSAKEKQIIKLAHKAWGCDECSLACPHNAHPIVTDIEQFCIKSRNIDDKSISDDESFLNFSKGRAFAWRGRAVLARNLDVLNDSKN